MGRTPCDDWRRSAVSALVLLFLASLLFAACGEAEGDVPAAPSGLRALVVSGSEIRLLWTDNSHDEVGFRVERSTGDSPFAAVVTVAADVTSHLVSGLQEGVSYSFRVSAYNKKGEAPSGVVERAISLVLEGEYEGTLTLRFTNAFPSFDESAEVAVEVNLYGGMTFDTATLDYNAVGNNGTVKIQRTGTLTLAPYGSVDNADLAHLRLVVDENTTVQERFQTWVWDGLRWQPSVDETSTGLWHRGLAFPWDAAVAAGATVSATTSQGSAEWTLKLTPAPAP